MKILFAGSPGSSAEILQDLFNQECEIVGVISQPDKRSKRAGGKDPSSVSLMATNLGLPLFKPSKIDNEFKEIISTIQCDFLVVSAYGKILPEWFLGHPDISSINIHFSLLPKYRGASPIQSCILNGDLDSGISIMQMTRGLDEGPIYCAEKITIPENADKHILETELTKAANKVLFTTLLEVAKNKKVPIAQDDAAASYCKKITKSSGKVNFIDEDASSVIRKFNAFKDWPGIFFEKNNVVIKIHGIRVLSDILHSNESKEFYFCADGLAVKTSSSTLVITHLQFPGKNIIASQDAANSYAKFFAD
ncbi:methionyl-tRNA formyltransferase [Gammaproteobacteria bacterium]|nr:methionyl-tRNA formyltransferase [Gammaproteobacteria bacterium]MDC3398213.1 methionyl-tRNA formyltransferase [Gammaproteobacteria bacterium]